ncbi:MAG TPA: hypothetical protein VHO24_18790 [Opitutaceae bacterium]|nr:hypothetical protein [Opitutaceae bacterium]
MATTWRARLLDLAVVAGAFAISAGVFKVHPGWMAFAATLFFWGAGLTLTGNYRIPAGATLFNAASKLLIDHAIIAAVWTGALRLMGIKLPFAAIAGFAGISFAGLVAVRSLTGLRARLGSARLVTPALLAADSLAAALSVSAVSGLWWGLAIPLPRLLACLVLRAGVGAVFQSWPAPAAGNSRPRQIALWLGEQAAFVLLMVATTGFFQWPLKPWQLIVAAGLIPALVTGVWRLARVPVIKVPGEEWRLILLGVAAYALMRPYFSRELIGTFDAKLYAEALQDFLLQIKAGVFPVLISQTDIAPFGAVFPFRMASYHFYFGGLLNALTGGSLNVYAVQHLTLVLSAFGGGYAMYATLKSLVPVALRWECAALAFLYLASPAWLAALYGKDMYFTFMTVPWMPVVLWSVVRTFRDGAWKDYLWLGASLALVWLAHPPVGFWASVVVLVAQVARLVTRWPGPRDLVRLAAAAGLCGLLCAGLFVSLADARIAGEYLDPAANVLKNLRDVAPAVFRPVSASADSLSDFQLGYALQILLVVALVFRRPGTKREQGILAGVGVILLLLVYPVPGITGPLWRALPYEVANITNVWPMQRIYPLVAAIIAFAAILALEAAAPARLRRIALAVLCLWSGWEAAKFTRRGHAVSKPAEATRVASKLENSPLLPNWTAYTPAVPTEVPLVGRVTDPRLLNRVLSNDGKSVLVANEPAPSAGDFVDALPLDPGVLRIRPDLTLVPGRRYQLTLGFLDHTYAGVLQVLSLEVYPRFYQEIAIGEARPKRPLTISLWTSESEPVAVALFFRPSDPAYAAQAHARFFELRLQPYEHDTLPVRVTSLAPYRAAVEAPAAGFLETHRFFARGYRAIVNGREVAVGESPRHFTMLPVAAGKNEVQLDYLAPGPVRAAFWVSAASWVALVALALITGIKSLLAARRPDGLAQAPT